MIRLHRVCAVLRLWLLSKKLLFAGCPFLYRQFKPDGSRILPVAIHVGRVSFGRQLSWMSAGYNEVRLFCSVSRRMVRLSTTIIGPESTLGQDIIDGCLSSLRCFELLYRTSFSFQSRLQKTFEQHARPLLASPYGDERTPVTLF